MINIYFYLKPSDSEQNVEDLEMVVLVDSGDKIMGRALLWTDVEGRKLLDRVYYINDKDRYILITTIKY